MPVRATVVVNAAGLGSRLGLDRPKALLEVEGRPLIAWQLELLRDVPDVRVVLGHHAADVAEVVFAQRPDAIVVLNRAYGMTGTAASLMLGARHADGLVVSLDGDLIVHPEDLAAFVDADAPMLGVLAPAQSLESVLVDVHEDGGVALSAQGFVRGSAGPYEWSGLVTFDPTDPRLGPADYHVFELVSPLLPLPARVVRAVEVDYADEVAALAAWIAELRSARLLP